MFKNLILTNNNYNIKIIIYYYSKSMSNNNIIIQDESNNNEETKIKRTRNRLTKKQQFVKEREDLINKLNNILGISDKNNTFYLYDVENSQEIKDKIKEIVEDVKKYFKCGTWYYFTAGNSGEEVTDISLIRAIYRDNDYTLTKKDVNIKKLENKIRTTQYYIFKK